MFVCDKCRAMIIDGDKLKKTTKEKYMVMRPDDYDEPDKGTDKIVTFDFEQYTCPKCGYKNILNATSNN